MVLRRLYKSNLMKYGLTTLFCYQLYQLGVDNLADHLLNIIRRMTKQSERKKASLTQQVAKKINDLSDLYKIVEIARDQPHDIIEDAIYASVPFETIEQLLKIKKLSRSIKQVVRETLVKKYSKVYRHKIFEQIEFFSKNNEFIEALSYIKEHSKSRSDFIH